MSYYFTIFYFIDKYMLVQILIKNKISEEVSTAIPL